MFYISKKTNTVKMGTFDEYILSIFLKQLSKVKVKDLKNVASHINEEIKRRDGTNRDKVKADIYQDVSLNLKTKSNVINIIKETNIGCKPEVKNLIDNVSVDTIIESGICLTKEAFFNDYPLYSNKFTKEVKLHNHKNNIRYIECDDEISQGLYILTITKGDGHDYIVKLGSYAETQGIKRRIDSFGGGNYETGSATNKWFQRFIKNAIEQGYTAKFSCYDYIIKDKYTITDLDNNTIEVVPYIIRPLETQLFNHYNISNHNITPIFGSNCSTKK